MMIIIMDFEIKSLIHGSSCQDFSTPSEIFVINGRLEIITLSPRSGVRPRALDTRFLISSFSSSLISNVWISPLGATTDCSRKRTATVTFLISADGIFLVEICRLTS